MTQITIRGIDPQIEEEIRRDARRSGKSLNRVVLDMLRKSSASVQSTSPRGASLKELAGGWSKEDESAFSESIKPCEQIDKAMWE